MEVSLQPWRSGISIVNKTGSDAEIELTYSARGPQNETVFDDQWTDPIPPGMWQWGDDWTVPDMGGHHLYRKRPLHGHALASDDYVHSNRPNRVQGLHPIVEQVNWHVNRARFSPDIMTLWDFPESVPDWGVDV